MHGEQLRFELGRVEDDKTAFIAEEGDVLRVLGGGEHTHENCRKGGGGCQRRFAFGLLARGRLALSFGGLGLACDSAMNLADWGSSRSWGESSTLGGALQFLDGLGNVCDRAELHELDGNRALLGRTRRDGIGTNGGWCSDAVLGRLSLCGWHWRGGQ